jgi:hypothetical protein
MAIKIKWRTNLLNQTGGKRIRFGRVANVALQDCKLITTKPGHDVAFTYATAHSLGHLSKQLVAKVVPQGVVDRFKPVKIETQHRKSLISLQVSKAIYQLFVKVCAIR